MDKNERLEELGNALDKARREALDAVKLVLRADPQSEEDWEELKEISSKAGENYSTAMERYFACLKGKEES
jgi:hypothetical protein